MIDVLFINTDHKKELRCRTNGTLLLGTKLLEAGFGVDILRFCDIDSYETESYGKFIDDITSKIISLSPKCVSFYTLWPYYHIMLRIAQRVKAINSDIITVFGGPQASGTAMATMEAMGFVDYIATGEGENTVVPFFECILNNMREGIETIPGLYYRENGIIKQNDASVGLCDLNALPRWDERLYTVDEPKIRHKDYFMPIDVGRGCPYSCTFCCSSIFWKRNYRLKTPEKIVEEIKYFNQKFGISSFSFSHDAFTTNRKLVSAVCDHIIDSGLDISWKCTGRVNCIDEEIILKMKRAGLCHAELGVETGSPRMQVVINKKLDLDDLKKKVSFLLDNGIGVSLFFMYGFPEETEDDLNMTLELYFDVLDMGVKFASMAYCRFNPQTPLTKKYFDDLVFDPDIKILSRGVYGYEEEIDMLKNNKAVFTCFYHLDTEVRNKFQFIHYLAVFYGKFTESMKYIRPLYKGDNLKLYRDFFEHNRDLFDDDTKVITDNLKSNTVQIFANTFKGLGNELYERIKAILEYDYDLQAVARSKADKSLRKRYSFNYIEYQLMLPIYQFSAGETELLIEKKNGKVDIQVLSF